MQYAVFVLSGLIAAWLAYLCVRSFLPKIPGQRRVYREISPATVIAYTVIFSGLLTLASAAANAGGAGAWFVAVSILIVQLLSIPVMSKAVACSIAFSEDGFAMRDIFGPMRTYRWTEVLACEMRAETARSGGKVPVTYNYDLYLLTLPDRVVRVNSGEDAGRELLQIFEEKRPELRAVRSAGISR